MRIDAVAFSFAGDKYLGTPYSTMDCQAFVEKCMSDSGLHMNLAGSNAWYREVRQNGWVGTPEECRRTFGEIPKGALLFILKQDGGEPGKYRDDGIGNASHIGIYIGRHDGAINSSSSKGQVCYSKFSGKSINGGWNRVGLYNKMDYGKTINWFLEHGGSGDAPREDEKRMQGRVTAPTGSTVNLRKTKGGDLLERIPIGTAVTVVDYGPEWCKVITGGLSGWMMTKFIDLDGEIIPGDEEPDSSPTELEDHSDFIPAEEPDEYGPGDTVRIDLSYESLANAYTMLKNLITQIEDKVGRG